MLRSVLLLLAIPAALGGWSHETWPQGNLTREYWVYTPSNASHAGPTGLMMFFHGSYMTDEFPWGDQVSHWQVPENAERYGFIGVVLKGTQCQDASNPLFCWNVNDPHGVNEVDFAHAVHDSVVASKSIPATVPKIVLGFSNGAAMADMLGCHNGTTLYTAHVGLYYNPASNFPSTCQQLTEPCSKWAGVGTQDPFIWYIGEAGLVRQFETLHSQYGCSDAVSNVTTNTSSGPGWCADYPQCPGVGQLCVYDHVNHEIVPGVLPAAWTYLSGVTGPTRCLH